MTSVLITHPGIQHSHQFALALQEAGMLSLYVSGVPVKCSDKEWAFLPKETRAKIKTVAIPKFKRYHPIYWQLILRLMTKTLVDAGYRHDFSHRLFHAFDKSMANQVLRIKPDVVVCFENSAQETFLAAKSIGAKCILDAPSIDYRAAKRLMPFVTKGYLDKINLRKKQEIELADAIITCSAYGASTYEDAGVACEKLYPMLLGAEPPVIKSAVKPECLTFVFAGAMSHRKSIDLILRVFMRLYQEGENVQLNICGGSESVAWIKKCRGMQNVTYYGAVPQTLLFQHIASSNCMLLPSRFDSFGMVVVEAMAVGVPSIVSNYTGAKEIIQKFPDSGWIIDATEEDIYESIKKIIVGTWDLNIASRAALEASKNFTWAAYRKRVVGVVKSVVSNE